MAAPQSVHSAQPRRLAGVSHGEANQLSISITFGHLSGFTCKRASRFFLVPLSPP